MRCMRGSAACRTVPSAWPCCTKPPACSSPTCLTNSSPTPSSSIFHNPGCAATGTIRSPRARGPTSTSTARRGWRSGADMLAQFLRVGMAIELLAAFVLGRALVLVGLPLWLAVVLAALLPLALQGVPLAIEFVTGALIDRRPVARLGFLELVAVWWRETWRAWVVFNVD